MTKADNNMERQWLMKLASGKYEKKEDMVEQTTAERHQAVV